jgi:outer membrane receptor protein involved in Fe transport
VSQFAFSQLYIYDRLGTRKGNLPPGESQTASIYNNHILRSKINYQFNRALSFRMILDYNSILPNEKLVALERDKNFTADFLMTYLVNPGTALYAGYSDGYRNLIIDPNDPSSLRRIASPSASTGRQFFVKMSYLLRF